ncbi:hypothetical protein ZWY2020_010902 [Hordeum vulgare]|nr:hypothetical protein ZWY2020_010902 [Hordeum vulgare]
MEPMAWWSEARMDEVRRGQLAATWPARGEARQDEVTHGRGRLGRMPAKQRPTRSEARLAWRRCDEPAGGAKAAATEVSRGARAQQSESGGCGGAWRRLARKRAAQVELCAEVRGAAKWAP